jgi:hypothetical protein
MSEVQSLQIKNTVLWITIFLAQWLALLRLPTQVAKPQLDSSWESALSYFAAERMQFGTDVVFTYGPLGYLYSSVYSGYLIQSRFVLELLSTAILVGLLLIIASRAGKFLGGFFILIIFLWPPVPDARDLFTLTSVLILLLRPKHELLTVAGVVFLAYLSLIKFTL